MRVERLPFTVYDIMGYFIPGLYFSIIFDTLIFKKEISDVLGMEGQIFWFFGSIAIITVAIESYIMGHVIAILSVEFLERLVVGFLGYPSEFLILSTDDYDEALKKHYKKCMEAFYVNRPIRGVFLSVIQLPHCLVLLILSRVILRTVLLKPIGRASAERFKKRFTEEFCESIDDLDSSDWFQMIEYYIVNRGGYIVRRQYNYVTLYGFCRNMSFSLYVLFVIFVTYVFFFLEGGEKVLDSGLIFALLFPLFMSLVLMIGFAKYFRRYSQDAIMAFAMSDGTEEGDE